MAVPTDYKLFVNLARQGYKMQMDIGRRKPIANSNKLLALEPEER